MNRLFDLNDTDYQGITKDVDRLGMILLRSLNHAAIGPVKIR
jgi:hypothetical protein